MQNAINYEQARFNMVEQQLRTWEVLDQKVLDVIGDIPREAFVPDNFQSMAYADINVPLPEGQVMMAPRLEARLAQALRIESGDRILEIGTGSGFLTTVLAKLGKEVVSVEISDTLATAAEKRLASQGVTNARVVCADGVDGRPDDGPYDAIAVTGSVPVIRDSYLPQLRPGGRLFVIVGEEPAMEAQLITRVGDTSRSVESLFETVLPPLQGALPPKQFKL